MEPKRQTIITKVWLNGNPVFSLNYMENQKVVHTDITGLRPDPVDYLKEDIEYDAKIEYSAEKDRKNRDQWVLKSIIVLKTQPLIKFVNIR